MKTFNLLIFIFAALMLINCESPLYIEAGVNWSDDSHFNQEGDWYLALSEGCFSNCTGATINVVDQIQLSVNKPVTERFTLNSGSAGNITAFVFLDVNQNGLYDDGYDKMTGYKFNYADKGESTCIAVSAFF